MADQEIPAVPFEKKTKKYGVVTVTAIERTRSGGLLEIDDNNHAPFWVRAVDVLGFNIPW